MIPKAMEVYLKERLPEKTFQNRVTSDNSKCYMEFTSLDIERLSQLDIKVDNLGPMLVICMWDEKSPYEIGGYLVVDNLAMGRPSLGGVRMLPNITPAIIHNLSRGMTLKNSAANLPFGGGKAGIVSDVELPSELRTEVIRGFARLIKKYEDIYLPGPDVGVNDHDMGLIAAENGLDNAVSKPVSMGGNRIDELGAAAGGVIIALEILLEQIPRLNKLTQFCNFAVPKDDEITVIIQGFGAVGAHAARFLKQKFPNAKLKGISDKEGYLYSNDELPIKQLFTAWQENGLVTRDYYENTYNSVDYYPGKIKYSTCPDDLLRESAFCFIPAAPIAHYLDIDESTQPTMTVEAMGKWSVLIEGANTYSPNPERISNRERMERAVYRDKGVMIATDYLVNSGGVIFAAQEQIIKTPHHLQIPDELLGNLSAVDEWLEKNQHGLEELATKRLKTAEEFRERVIRNNMIELVDLLINDIDLLPSKAAEMISVRRIISKESERNIIEIMEDIPIINGDCTIQQASQALISSYSPIVAIVREEKKIIGLISGWDIANATAKGILSKNKVIDIMTKEIVSASVNDHIIEVINKLEINEFSAMPIVENGNVVGMVCCWNGKCRFIGT
jgi:glutamate dehydrogenase (NAD(P)+)